MALLNFPSDPYVGQIAVVGTKTYRWSGSAWLVQSATLAATSATITNVRITSTENINTATIGFEGALIVNGGASIAKDLYVGGVLYTGGSLVLTTSSFNNTTEDGTDIDIVQNGDVLTFNNISTLQTVTGRGNSTTNIVSFTNLTESTARNVGAVIISGGLGVSKRINSESIQIADTVFDSTKTTVNSTGEYDIDEYWLDEYRSAKYFVQIDEGSTTSTARCHAVEMTLTANNNAVPYLSAPIGQITSNGVLGTFNAYGSFVDTRGKIRLTFTPIDTIEKTIKVLRTAMTV